VPGSVSTLKKNFPARYESLVEIARFIHPCCQNACLDSNSCYHVESAVDEACSNIIEHAYAGEENGNIEISCQDNPADITITIVDHGKNFNPENILDPDTNASLEDRESHGLGLFFIRKLMDQVEFSRAADNSNILTLVKFKK